jgi:hypothetical protein
MKFVLVISAAVAIVTPARAQDRTIRELTDIALEANGLCRGYSSENEKQQKAVCDHRDRLFNLLSSLNYCYGKQNQIGADYRWHKCTRGSNK